MSRWLGIDHGTKRIGVAVGSTDDNIATPVSVIPADPIADALGEIVRLAGQYEAAGVVVGWPINMDDSEGPQGKAARAMAAQLAKRHRIDVRLWDERLSSFAADQALAGKLTRKQRRSRQDSVAAAMMLQDFLANDGPAVAQRPHQIARDRPS